MIHICLLPLVLAYVRGDAILPASAPASSRPDLQPAFQAWTAAHGGSWRLLPDPGTGWLQMLAGGRASAPFPPRTDADFAEVARQALARTAPLHGVDADTIVLDRALFLPLGQIGSGDKETVRFREIVRGVPVVDAYLNVLLASDGSLLSVQSTALPHLSSLPTQPALSSRQASQLAARFFLDRIGARATRAGEPGLVIDQASDAEGIRRPRLAWQVDVQRIVEGFAPEGLTFWIDARDGSLVRSERNVHDLDVGGTVSSMATPGMDPDTAANPPAPRPMKYLIVQSAAGIAVTDANGQFGFPGVNVPLACTFTYVGGPNAVSNAAGPDYSLTQTLAPGVPNAVLMNPAGAAETTAAANVFDTVDKQRDWVRAINPAENSLEFVHSAAVNLAQTCNAYFDGGQINFFAEGGGCPNTAYSTVVSHEDGHWANVAFGTGNGPDGMGEGNADTWAEYVWDTPVVAAGFYGPGTVLRDGRNTRQFCGDCCGGCYGEVHTDGEVWMGAAWKVRSRLVASNGATAGSLAANTLFLGWMEAYNQQQIKSVIETQWLTLDDDDGNINNGTPHDTDIDQAFREQGFPGVHYLPLSYGAVTDVADTQIQDQPETVVASIHANVAPPLTAVLRYRVNGGPFQDLPLASLGGDQFEATIPGQLAPAHVEYYLTATDSASNTAVAPVYAPEGLFEYDVGEVHVLRLDTFEFSGYAGWTHGTYGDTANPEDDWMMLGPAGKSGVTAGIPWSDPPAAFSGSICWGNGLGWGSNTGAYSSNVHNWLRTPPIDCTGAVGTELRFQRWLSVEGSASDQARILVNGIPVFSNPATPLVDAGWTNQRIDISAIADGNPSVQVEFELESDGVNQFGGWQIDDFELLWLGVPACPSPSNFCYQAPNSADSIGAFMDFSGTAKVSSNDLVLRTTGCPARKNGRYLYGRNTAALPFGNGILCLAPPIFRLPVITTDSSGAASFPLDLHHLPAQGEVAAGEDWYFQLWFRDPAAGGSLTNTSDSLKVTFCP